MNVPEPTRATCLKNLTVPYYLNLGPVTAMLHKSLSSLDQHLPVIWQETLSLSRQNPAHSLSLLADLLSESNPCLYTFEGKQKIYRESLKRLLAAYLLNPDDETFQDGPIKPQGHYLTMRTYEGLYFLDDFNWDDGLELLMSYSYIAK